MASKWLELLSVRLLPHVNRVACACSIRQPRHASSIYLRSLESCCCAIRRGGRIVGTYWQTCPRSKPPLRDTGA